MMTARWHPPVEELDACIERALGDLRSWSGARLLITGGTGFLGRWIVGTIMRANSQFNVNLRLDVLSRDPGRATLSGEAGVEVIRGDVRNFSMDRSYDVIVHGAASSSAPFGVGEGAQGAMAATIIDGTRHIIDIASRSRARVLFLSSGAVYGQHTTPVLEDAPALLDPLEPASAYGEAKRLAENFCAVATKEGQVDAVIARLFAFVGPGIPLGAHYAVGNFLGDVLAGRDVVVRGDGRPLRSYLYCADLSEWCWALISRGRSGRAYNVGSPEAISIRDLAERVAGLVRPRASVRVLLPSGEGPAPCYVPVTELSFEELQLAPRVELEEGLNRTFAWYRETG